MLEINGGADQPAGNPWAYDRGCAHGPALLGFRYRYARTRARETDRMMLSNRDRRDEN
jgi:hypothetical protein